MTSVSAGHVIQILTQPAGSVCFLQKVMWESVLYTHCTKKKYQCDRMKITPGNFFFCSELLSLYSTSPGSLSTKYGYIELEVRAPDA